jgi:hypothetical protein
MPYIAFSVLYDYKHKMVGVKLRDIPVQLASAAQPNAVGQSVTVALPATAAQSASSRQPSAQLPSAASGQTATVANVSGRWQINSARAVPLRGFVQVGSNVTGSCIGPGATGPVIGSVIGQNVQLRWQWSNYNQPNSYAYDFAGTLDSPISIAGKLTAQGSPPVDFTAQKQ